MWITRWITDYISHPDPLTAKSNLVTFVIASNGPFYPFYVYLLIGKAAFPTLLTMLASPVFLALPALARRHGLAGRAALPVVGTLNTVWCAKLLGVSSGVELFLLPCISLAALSFQAAERRLKWAVLALPFALYLWQNHGGGLGVPLLAFTQPQDEALRSLNIASVGTLTAFLGLVYAAREA